MERRETVPAVNFCVDRSFKAAEVDCARLYVGHFVTRGSVAASLPRHSTTIPCVDYDKGGWCDFFIDFVSA
jgi:hypothetical protein